LDWQEALGQLAKRLALAMPGVVLRAIFWIGLAFWLNLVFAVLFFGFSGLGGHGHGAPILLPIAIVPFVPFFAGALALAFRRATRTLIGAAVGSQAEPLVRVAEHAVREFVAARAGSWPRHVASLPEVPLPVRFVLARLWRQVPRQEDVARVIRQTAERGLRPSWKAELWLLAANVVWFVLLTAGATRLGRG
jgi:hypothetical protein